MSALDPVYVHLAQLLASFVFASAALHKLRAPRAFAAIVRDYRLVPPAFVSALVPALIACELAIATGVWFAPLRGALAAAGALLLALYGLAIAANLARGRREIDCGCSWGGARQPLSAWLLLRNLLLLGICALAGAGLAPRPLGGPDLALIALAGASLGLCYRSFETLIAQQPRIRALRG